MDEKLAKMVTALFPDAIPGEDFAIEMIGEKAVITKWDELKLGRNPGVQKIHHLYMNYVKKKKGILPNFDDTDPLPYLSEKRAFRSFEINTQPIEVFNGCTFQKRN
jgi:hypothetical protein